jgi:hypothetical protein
MTDTELPWLPGTSSRAQPTETPWSGMPWGGVASMLACFMLILLYRRALLLPAGDVGRTPHVRRIKAFVSFDRFAPYTD